MRTNHRDERTIVIMYGPAKSVINNVILQYYLYCKKNTFSFLTTPISAGSVVADVLERRSASDVKCL